MPQVATTQAVTKVGQRLRDANIGYETWRHLLADSLDLPLSELPISPSHLEGDLTLQSLVDVRESPRSGAGLTLPPAASRALR